MSWLKDLEKVPGYHPPLYGDEVDFRCIPCGAVLSEGGCEHDFERDYIEVAKGQALGPQHNHDARGIYPGCPACGTTEGKEERA